MEPNWAAEHLQVIRTLMERSALYRRALAPVMLFLGALGLVATAVGLLQHLDSVQSFGLLWLSTAVIGVAGAFLITRRQALKDHEPFWSPPTRRVGQAALPPLLVGMILGLLLVFAGISDEFILPLAFLWALLYGCALHAVGFFMPRGMKLFGWIFIAAACVLLVALVICRPDFPPNGNWIMGFFFGLLQLAYGGYLYLTEKGKNAA